MANIVQFNDLEKCKTLGLKSPILILQDENSIKASLLIEELEDVLKPATMTAPRGQSIWTQWSSSGSISFYDDSEGNTKTNIIQYPYSEVVQQYDIMSALCPITFEDNDLNKSCYIFCKEGPPTSLMIYTGTITHLDLSGCPSIKAIYFVGPNNIDTDFLDLRNLFNFNVLDMIASSRIKIILGYSKINKKYYILSNFTKGRILNVAMSNVVPYIQYMNPYETLTPYYLPNYINETFTQNELQVASEKNIRLINVR